MTDSRTINFMIISALLENFIAGAVYLGEFLTVKELAFALLVSTSIKSAIGVKLRFMTTTGVKQK